MGPEKMFTETKLINGGKLENIKCAELGIERIRRAESDLVHGSRFVTKCACCCFAA